MSTRLPYLKHATDSHRDPWLRSMIREHGDAFHRMYWDLLEMLQADGSGEEVTLLTVNLHDLAAAMMRKPTLVLKFLDVLSSKWNGFVKYKYERIGDELDISAFKFRDYQHNLGSRAGADGNHNGGGSGVDKTRCRQEERVPSKGVESETKTKTPPTQSIIIEPPSEPKPARDRYGRIIPLTTPGGGPLIRNVGGDAILYPRFDLLVDGVQQSFPESRVKRPTCDPGEGRKWCWRAEAVCWYVDLIDDKKNFTYGIPTAEYKRMSFGDQEKAEMESNSTINYDAAMLCYSNEDDRRTKILEDSNGTTARIQTAMDAAEKERRAKLKADDEARQADMQKAAHKTAPSKQSAHGKTKPDSHRKFFK